MKCDRIHFTAWLLEKKTNGPLTSISIVHSSLRVGSYTGAWTAYRWPLPPQERFSSSSCQLPIALQLGVGLHELLPIHTGLA